MYQIGYTEFPLPIKTDQYKGNSHYKMLPKGILSVYSYCEARAGAKFDEIVFHGLQGNILRHLAGNPLTKEGIEYSKYLFEMSNFHEGCFNEEDWMRLLRKHEGRLPVRIKSLPEGTIVSPGNSWFTIEGLDNEFPWLSQRLESLLLHSWYPTTIATRSRNNIKVIKRFLKESSDLDPEFARHLYVDFGYRACSCNEQAAIGGAAHGINSYASDTVVALNEIHRYYGGLTEKGILYSVPASEHCIPQSFGEEGEEKYLLTMMKLFPSWILSLVADTYNIERFVDVIVRKNKEAILKRWREGKAEVNKLIIRPDSLRFKEDTPKDQMLWIFQKLEDIFGVTVNSKGKKVLHPCIGSLWGDGISDSEIYELYEHISNNGYSVESLVVGQGGGLLVKGVDRDTLRVALKASRQKRNEEGWVDVIKNPLDKSKRSKTGELRVIVNKSGILETVNHHDSRFYREVDKLVTVFENGEVMNLSSYKEIRERAA